MIHVPISGHYEALKLQWHKKEDRQKHVNIQLHSVPSLYWSDCWNVTAVCLWRVPVYCSKELRSNQPVVQEHYLIHNMSLSKRISFCISYCRQCKQMPEQQGYYTQSSPERTPPNRQNQLDVQQSSCFFFSVPRCSLVALELPGVHPPEPCHGAAGVRCHGSYHPVGQRMEEVEAVGRIKMPIKDCTVFCLKNSVAY